MENRQTASEAAAESHGEAVFAAPTMDPFTANPQKPARRLPPVAHYQPLRYLGGGAMGRVYEAFDQRLKRSVAIKFLHGEEPEREARFIREARAQARVDHPNVCKVYEIGEAEGRPFIVMQLVRGQSLKTMAPRMNLEQKLQVVKQVAKGMHEAHRVGLVHRDLKPGNIMVERAEDGSFQAFVVDFGVARVELEQDLTLAGEILGTPGYMAPEQARGELKDLDRRTDVYSLGATLYQLLTGQAPFGGDSLERVLADILSKEPIHPKRFNKAIPGDVETIVLKCLQKEPDRRYPSARALAEDLVRYLNGDPIEALPMGRFYRWRKWLGKHRVLVTTGLIALLAIAVSLLWGVWRGGARERLARELTTQVAEIEALARHTALSRRHDVRPDREHIRRGMKNMREVIRRHGKSAQGPGYYALGRGALALGEPDRGRAHLETAWRLGYRNSRVAYSLGLAYCQLFRQRLGEVQLLEDPDERNFKIRQLETQLRDPARSYMRQARGTPLVSSDYLEALLAYCEGHYEAALALLVAPKTNRAWFYEAHKLEADIFRDWAQSAYDAGDKECARTYFDQALTAYTQASEIAQSDPEIYQAHLATLLRLINTNIFSGEDLEDVRKRCLLLSAWALRVLPDSGRTWILKAKLHRQMAQHRRVNGKDPEPFLQQALAALSRAGEYGAPAGLIGLESATVYRRWAQWRNDRNTKDSEVMIRNAVAALNEIPSDQKDYVYYHSLASTYRIWGKSLLRRGQPACETYSLAIKAYRQAAALRPDRLEASNNLALCLLNLSETPACNPSPKKLLTEAAGYLEEVVVQQGNQWVPRYHLGRCYLRLAQDGDPQSASLDPLYAQMALHQYRSGLALNPDSLHLHNVLGEVHLALARSALEQGQRPEADFAAAIEAYDSGLSKTPNNWRLQLSLASTHYFFGKYLIRHGLPPGEHFKKTSNLLVSVMDQVPFMETYICRGSLFRLLAERVLQTGGDPREYFGQAQAAFFRVLEDNPIHPEAFRSLGRLHSLESAWLKGRPTRRRVTLALARDFLDQALELLPNAPYVLLADVHWYLQMVLAGIDGNRPIAEFFDRGLAQLDRLLHSHPCFPEVLALKSAFLLLEPHINVPGGAARSSGNPTQDRIYADFDQMEALAANGFLRYSLQEYLPAQKKENRPAAQE